MTESQLLKYCKFYRGETLAPPAYDGKPSEILWTAEKFVCEHFGGCIDSNNPAVSFRDYVLSYVGKWWPYDAPEIEAIY